MSVRYALLALLSEEPKPGLQLREEFETWAGEAWPLNEGQVDATLQRLEREGLVESGTAAADGPQEGFRITPGGEQELGCWLHAPPELAFPSRDEPATPSHDELAMKILVALRVPGTDVHEVIQVHRRYLVELMQQCTRIKQDKASHELSLALAVDAELFRLDSVIRWLDAADGRLERTAASLSRPVPPALPRLRVKVPPDGRDHQETSRADNHIRTSAADRESSIAALRDHYAEGRLTCEELDERVAAALTARTFGDLRSVMADLPEPAHAPQHARRPPPAAMPRPVLGLRSPLIPLLAALAMLGVLLIPGRWPFIAFLEALLVTALIAGPAAATRFRRRMRRH
jgi:DNA-binding PadR family transcriptional regulator